MNLSPVQFDTNCYDPTSPYHPIYYANSTSSSTAVFCPSMATNYLPSENYYPSGSEMFFYPSPSFPQDDFIIPLSQNRANYTRQQLVMLNEIFKEHKYPNSLQKTLIAQHIGVSRDQIRIWFQNKRRKMQLINKGQAKQSKTDIECEYQQHLPNPFLDNLFQELYQARGAPARLPVRRYNKQEQHNLMY